MRVLAEMSLGSLSMPAVITMTVLRYLGRYVWVMCLYAARIDPYSAAPVGCGVVAAASRWICCRRVIRPSGAGSGPTEMSSLYGRGPARWLANAHRPIWALSGHCPRPTPADLTSICSSVGPPGKGLFAMTSETSISARSCEPRLSCCHAPRACETGPVPGACSMVGGSLLIPYDLVLPSACPSLERNPW